MKQVTQSQSDGVLRVVDVPPPALRPGGVLVRTAFSVISAGTERSKVDVARKSLLGKARARPDQVRQVLEAVRREGLKATHEKVRSRLEQLSPLGYSAAGVVVEVGAGVDGFRVGDRVACAGGYAAHAEFNFVPVNLCVPAPLIPLQDAAYGTLGAIALQGVRQADVRVGEVVGVIGLGLIGLISAQILKAAGCRVLGIEPDAQRRELASSLGLDATSPPGESAIARAVELSGGYGADAVVITAATRSSAPVELAGRLCRDRGRVVMVGATGMTVPRSIYYDKELDFRLSRSYGPGRYDPEYEEKGNDYPIGYVRWTEKRNIAGFLDLVSEGKVRLGPLTSHIFPVSAAAEAYDLITRGHERYLGVLLDYGLSEAEEAPAPPAVRRVDMPGTPEADAGGRVGIGLIGAGSFATGTLLPALSASGRAGLKGVATASGLSARSVAERAGFAYASSDGAEVIADPEVQAVVVATRHDTHASFVIEAIRAGKAVFVEKPLAIRPAQLGQVLEAAAHASAPFVMVGFNRRFAPLTRELRSFFDSCTEPLVMHYRVNAGFLPPTHWTHDSEVGGGRIVGEACHFVDLLMHLAGAAPTQVFAQALPDGGRYRGDNVSVQIRFANGALGTLHYLANGDRAVAKERLEVWGGGAVGILDDFRRLTLARGGQSRKVGRRWSRQDKGHRAEIDAFLAAAAAGGPSPIPLRESALVTATTFSILESLRTGAPIQVADPHGPAASSVTAAVEAAERNV